MQRTRQLVYGIARTVVDTIAGHTERMRNDPPHSVGNDVPVASGR